MTEEEVKTAFVSAYNKLVTEKKEIIVNAELIRKTLCDTNAFQKERQRLESGMVVLVDMVQGYIAENVRIAQDQAEYQKRYDGIVAKNDDAKDKFDGDLQCRALALHQFFYFCKQDWGGLWKNIKY